MGESLGTRGNVTRPSSQSRQAHLSIQRNSFSLKRRNVSTAVSLHKNNPKACFLKGFMAVSVFLCMFAVAMARYLLIVIVIHTYVRGVLINRYNI